MALKVSLTIGGTGYDVGSYVLRDSLEIIEELFGDSLEPNTNSATFVVSHACPLVDEIITCEEDIPIVIEYDDVRLFTGYLTNDHDWGISTRGGGDLTLKCEDPGIVKLKRAWESADGFATNMVGHKVCDPDNTGTSAVHTIAALAGVTLAGGLPTISETLYVSVLDSDGRTYWEVLAKLLGEFGYVFYFTRSGSLALYDLAEMTGETDHLVSTQEGVLSRENDPGIRYRKRLFRYREVDVAYRETTTLSSAAVFKDTTDQSETHDCNITLEAGKYYPTGATADDYAICEYQLDDGREIIAVASATLDLAADSGLTVEFQHLGKSGKLRIYNGSGTSKTITQLRVNGTNVVVKTADAKVIAGESSGKLKTEMQADYLTTKAQAQTLGNLFYYLYKNSTATYEFRAWRGTLYPLASLHPAETLFPLGDEMMVGEKVNLVDPVFTGLDVDVVVMRKSWVVGRDGASYEAIGIGAISLGDSVGHKVVMSTPQQTPISLPDVQAIASDALESAINYTDSAVAEATPKCLGLYDYSSLLSIAGMNKNDLVVLQSSTASERGIYLYSGSAWSKLTSPTDSQAGMALYSVLKAVENGYGTSGDYIAGSTSYELLLAKRIFVLEQTLAKSGFLKSYDYAEDGEGFPIAGFKLDVANQIIKAWGAMFADVTLRDIHFYTLPVFPLGTYNNTAVTLTDPGESFVGIAAINVATANTDYTVTLPSGGDWAYAILWSGTYYSAVSMKAGHASASAASGGTVIATLNKGGSGNLSCLAVYWEIG